MRRLSIALVLLVGLVAAACTPGSESGSPTTTGEPITSPEASMPAESLPLETLPLESMAPGTSPEASTNP